MASDIRAAIVNRSANVMTDGFSSDAGVNCSGSGAITLCDKLVLAYHFNQLQPSAGTEKGSVMKALGYLFFLALLSLFTLDCIILDTSLRHHLLLSSTPT